jgi:hypothetical protein
MKSQRLNRSEDAFEEQSLRETLTSEFWNDGKWCHRSKLCKQARDASVSLY